MARVAVCQRVSFWYACCLIVVGGSALLGDVVLLLDIRGVQLLPSIVHVTSIARRVSICYLRTLLVLN